MKNRYLPFGYKIADGKIMADSEQVEAVRRIFDAYTAGQTFQQIADVLSAQGIPYRSDALRWNKNMVSRILANTDYCGTAEYPQIITVGQLEAAEQIRKSKTVTYSATLKPFRKDMQCGCCGARLYWHSKSNQWFSCAELIKEQAQTAWLFSGKVRLNSFCQQKMLYKSSHCCKASAFFALYSRFYS